MLNNYLTLQRGMVLLWILLSFNYFLTCVIASSDSSCFSIYLPTLTLSHSFIIHRFAIALTWFYFKYWIIDIKSLAICLPLSHNLLRLRITKMFSLLLLFSSPSLSLFFLQLQFPDFSVVRKHFSSLCYLF